MKRSTDIAEVLSETIRGTSDHLNFPAARDLRLLFMSPGTRFTCCWSGGEGAVMHIRFRPPFLEEVALSSRVNAERLYQLAIQEIPLHELLASLCRVLMQEVQGGCRHELPFFEAISRALAFALVQSSGSPCAESARDQRIAKAVPFIKQYFQERVSLREIARAACLSLYYFLRLFRTVVGISPHAYPVQCRLRHARRLLVVSGKRTLADVAVEAGLYDQTHLTRHFRCAF